MMWIDARLPLRFAPAQTRTPDEALLTDADLEGPAGHPQQCACCTPRSTAALALAALFHARAVTKGSAFRSVLAAVNEENETALRAALQDDPIAAARFRAI